MVRKRLARAFTLAELMVVVAMVAVLAVIGVVTFRRFIFVGKNAEASVMVGNIRAAQERYRAETLGYLNVSATLNNYYPRATPDQGKTAWGDAKTPLGASWAQLCVRADAPVRFGYATIAGPAGGVAIAGLETAAPNPFPASSPEPWYVVQAKGDTDGNGKFAVFLSSSWNGEIYSENEGE